LDYVAHGLAAGVTGASHAKGRVVAAAVSNPNFIRPVKVSDVVCAYTEVNRTGRTPVTLGVETQVLRQGRGARVRVIAAEFVLVAVDDSGRPGSCGERNEID
jgi:acyl-CoA thioesterase YciA